MKQPLFSVGEEVVIQSVDYPECNGDAAILGVVVRKTTIMLRAKTGKMEDSGSYYSYRLSIDNGRNNWVERALRKKHKPADEGYRELISRLNKIPA